jgi:hypothetical protein
LPIDPDSNPSVKATGAGTGVFVGGTPEAVGAGVLVDVAAGVLVAVAAVV